MFIFIVPQAFTVCFVVLNLCNITIEYSVLLSYFEPCLMFQGSSLFLPVDLVSLSHAFFANAIWSLRLLKFIFSQLSVLIFILYCCIVYGGG